MVRVGKLVINRRSVLLTPRAEFEICGSGDARGLQSGRGIIDAAEGDSVIQ